MIDIGRTYSPRLDDRKAVAEEIRFPSHGIAFSTLSIILITLGEMRRPRS